MRSLLWAFAALFLMTASAAHAGAKPAPKKAATPTKKGKKAPKKKVTKKGKKAPKMDIKVGKAARVQVESRKGKKKVYRYSTFLVPGKVPRPMVNYVLPRSRVKYTRPDVELELLGQIMGRKAPAQSK